jgi:hypothetical protein
LSIAQLEARKLPGTFRDSQGNPIGTIDASPPPGFDLASVVNPAGTSQQTNLQAIAQGLAQPSAPTSPGFSRFGGPNAAAAPETLASLFGLQQPAAAAPAQAQPAQQFNPLIASRNASGIGGLIQQMIQAAMKGQQFTP